MKYQDKVYGEVEILEPVILDLINSPSMQRLKGVDQAGYRPLWVKPEIDVGENGNTRFAHSMGVFLLLKKYNAPVEEQVAGLIHDVSHSAFSHCVDYALDDGSEKEQNYQDNIFEAHVKNSALELIFKKHGLSLDHILDDSNFPLKENSLPDLCADRIDYCLRDAVVFQEIKKEDVDNLLSNLIARENKWVFKNFASAKEFSEIFYLMNKKYYAGFLAAVMLKAVGDYVRHALDKKYINWHDLFTTDKEVIEKVNKNLQNDSRLEVLFARMNNRNRCANSPEDYDAEVFCKSRAVDPLFLDGDNIKRASDVDKKWVKIMEQELKPKNYYLKFI